MWYLSNLESLTQCLKSLHFSKRSHFQGKKTQPLRYCNVAPMANHRGIVPCTVFEFLEMNKSNFFSLANLPSKSPTAPRISDTPPANCNIFTWVLYCKLQFNQKHLDQALYLNACAEICQNSPEMKLGFFFKTHPPKKVKHCSLIRAERVIQFRHSCEWGKVNASDSAFFRMSIFNGPPG